VSAEAIINVMDEIAKFQKIEGTTIVILCDSVQRQAVQKLAADTKHERFLSENLVTFIYKPVKPSRFAVIFDPDKIRDLSIDRNRSTAQQMVESQKASYQEIGKRMGNKGYRVLLVEDNLVNQKVLNKYLKKIGVDVEVAIDGVECTEIVLSKSHSYYSLILVSMALLSDLQIKPQV
jgi:PleD family two-component response regulator